MLATQQSYSSPQNPSILEDSLVIAYVSPKVMRAVYVKQDADSIVQFTTGTYHTQDWIGKQYGCAVYPRRTKENAQPLYLLAPSPELWTRVLSHRTQILYMADISLVCTFLELKPGSLVLESGTGSGSLTHALARAVAPTGHVYTFEFHEDRCAVAAEEFQKHGISEITTVSQRDVQSHGFPEEFFAKAHGVFLDLPEPWKAVQSAVACLRHGHCLVTFSPCIEQIQRTCQAITDTEEMIDVRIMECISREYRVKEENLARDIRAYHNQKSAPQTASTNSNKKRKETEDTSDEHVDAPAETESHDCGTTVINTRVVSLKGHTGFLAVARKFAKH